MNKKEVTEHKKVQAQLVALLSCSEKVKNESGYAQAYGMLYQFCLSLLDDEHIINLNKET